MRKLLKISLACAVGALIFTANPKTAMAYEEGIAGLCDDNLSSSEAPIPGYNNIGLANVDTNLLIRSGAGEDCKILGKLPKNGGCEILEQSNGWTKIDAKTASDEDLVGYVKSEFLITGTEAVKQAKEVGSYIARSNADGLNIRGSASTDSQIIDKMAPGEELIVLDSKVATDDKDHSEWVKVSIDSDEEDADDAYVAKEYVDITFELIHAVSMEELQYGAGTSQTRIDLVNMAKEHLGETYIWGGTRLGVGVDCSGFTQALYRAIGYSIPRTSGSQGSSGTTISSSDLKAGDLVFYGSSGHISHVAMYIGNNRIIHASNPRDGIKISNMYYRTPIKYVRYISN